MKFQRFCDQLLEGMLLNDRVFREAGILMFTDEQLDEVIIYSYDV